MHMVNRSTEQISLRTDASAEVAPLPPRFVIYGTNGAGSPELADLITGQLEELGIDESSVTRNRRVDTINQAFFGDPHAHVPATGQEATNSDHGLKRLGSAMMRTIMRTDDHTLEVRVPQEATASVPDGVFVFPEMRQYSEDGTVGMTVQTPYDRIADLCEKYAVPMVYVEKTSTAAGLVASIDQTAIAPPKS